jgi:NADPH oxidase
LQHSDGVNRYKQANEDRLAALNTLKWSVWISRGAGLVLSFDTTLILLPVCRTLVRWIRPKVKFLPLDENIWFHRQVAYAMLLFTLLHVAAHYVKYVVDSIAVLETLY